MRQYNLLDKIIIKFENFNTNKQGNSASLMRVNHTGEVCAQALYMGQAFVTKDPILEKKLIQAAQEEQVHLQWCKNRIAELNDKTSVLNPIFAAGSFMIGAGFGLAGDKISLGFLAETEHQVVKHIDKHLSQLSIADTKSREILIKMREDELRHAIHAIQDGGVELPFIIKQSMTLLSKIMTSLTRFI